MLNSKIKSTLTVLTLALTVLFGICETTQAANVSEIVPQDYLRWNNSHVNPNCSDAYGGRNPCEDIRICRKAAASLRMGGWPTLCGWVGKRVPKVCCGLPLVLGSALMKKSNEEKARKRRCGTTTWEALSETENKFFEIERSVPPIDISDPSKFDPPLELHITPRVTAVLPIGDRKSRQEDFPWMVSIRRVGNHWCAGTLIDRKHILSAAHCFVLKGPNTNDYVKPDKIDYVVYMGNVQVQKGYPITVKKIVVHPQYNPDFYYHDLAMLTLSEEILIPQYAHICLPTSGLGGTDLTGKNTTLLGWGETSNGGKSTPVLHIVDNLPVVSNRKCKENYKRVAEKQLPKGLTDDFICAGEKEGGRDICQKDSGGPLMYKDNYLNLPDGHPDIPWVLVGIVSFGFKCGESGYPGVYTRVSSHMNWITEEMHE